MILNRKIAKKSLNMASMISCIPLGRKLDRKSSENSSRVSQHSDEGYGSDKTPSPFRDTRENQKMVAKDVKEFKEKYVVEKLMNNSANGVIYKGKFSFIFQ